MDEPNRCDNGTSMRPRVLTVLALLAILLVAFALRVVDIQASFWSDEIRTYEGAVRPFVETLTHKRYPLYFVLAHLALYLGDTEALLRLPSVLAGTLAVLAMYFAGKTLHGRTAGLLGAWFFATWEYGVAYSQEARFYALMMLAGVVMFWLLDRAVTRGGVGQWALFTIAAFFGVLSHLFAVVFFASMVVGALIWLFFTRSVAGGVRWRRVAALVVCALLGLSGFLTVSGLKGGLPSSLVALVSEDSAVQNSEPAGGAVPAPMSAPEVAAAKPDGGTSDAAPTPSYKLTPRDYAGFYRRFCRGCPPITLFLLGLLALWGWGAWWRRQGAAACMAGAMMLLLPLPFFVFDTTHFYTSRYFSILFPITLLLVAGGAADLALLAGRKLGRGRRWIEGAVATGLVVALLALLASPTMSGLEYNYGRRNTDPWRGDWKGASAFIAYDLRQGNVFIQAIPEDRLWEIAYPLTYYLKRDVPNSNVTLHQLHYFHAVPSAQNLDQVFASYPDTSIWFVSKGTAYLSEGVVKRLQQAGAVHREFGVVDVWRLGEPTENLASWGGFEGQAGASIVGGPLSLTGQKEAFEGEHALKIALSEQPAAQIALPFSPFKQGVALDPSKTYTLSFWLRCLDVPPERAITFGVAGVTQQGQSFTREYLDARDTQAWSRQVVTIVPGEDIPDGTVALGLLIDVSRDAGTVWIDDVQLEAKPYPTPFVQGRRLPHNPQ